MGAESEELPEARELVRRWADSVSRVLRYGGVGEADLEDALQEVFLVAHRRRHEFRGGRADRWLRTIAFMVARNARRSRRRRREEPSDPIEAGVAPEQHEQLERTRMRERLSALLDTLPDEQRDVVVLYEIEQLPMREVAEELGVPLQTAYARARAARAALRRAWEGGLR